MQFLEMLAIGAPVADASSEPIMLYVHATQVRQHKDVRLIITGTDGHATGVRNEPLVALLVEARKAHDEILAMPTLSIAEIARSTGRCRKRLAMLMRIAMLAPDIVERCLAGTQPAILSTATLFATPLPIAWSEQRRILSIT